MAKTLVNVIKSGAVINVPMSTEDVAKLQSILLKHLDKQVHLDDASWNIIEAFCHRVDEEACAQNKMETREIQF